MLNDSDNLHSQQNKFIQHLDLARQQNPWFITSHISYAINAIADSLDEDMIDRWLHKYNLQPVNKPAKVAVITAGNIPVVGFHDFLCTLIAGHRFLGKLSSQDKVLLPLIADMLIDIEPAFGSYIEFEKHIIKDFDAVIATGSDNTARYFEYYFGKYPHIIRKNRSGVAVITGNENKSQLQELGKDIFLYFGLGCRNVSKIYLPPDFDPVKLTGYFDNWNYVNGHNKYMNNYDYFKSIYLINREDFYDNGFLLLKEDARIASPVSVLFYETYRDKDSLFRRLVSEADKIQCIVNSDAAGTKYYGFDLISPGKAQHPALWDYADNIDTLAFLQKLSN